jgi:hypothetical protein
LSSSYGHGLFDQGGALENAMNRLNNGRYEQGTKRDDGSCAATSEREQKKTIGATYQPKGSLIRA